MILQTSHRTVRVKWFNLRKPLRTVSGRVSTLLVVRKEFVFGSRALACRAIILKGISGIAKKMESYLGGVSIAHEIKPMPTY